MLSTVAVAVCQQLDALREASAQPFDITVFVDVVAATFEAPTVSFPSLLPAFLGR